MNLKDILQNDIKQVFLNPKEFGELHLIGKKEINIIIDNNEMLEREQKYKIYDNGISKKQLLIYVAEEDFGRLPMQGKPVDLDGKIYIVTDAINENGIYSINLEANISNDKHRR